MESIKERIVLRLKDEVRQETDEELKHEIIEEINFINYSQSQLKAKDEEIERYIEIVDKQDKIIALSNSMKQIKVKENTKLKEENKGLRGGIKFISSLEPNRIMKEYIENLLNKTK
jgi:hypothetical protein